jgi:hypothetical protein
VLSELLAQAPDEAPGRIVAAAGQA